MRLATLAGLAGFNSRSRVGSDVLTTIALAIDTGFQFALPRGERHILRRRLCCA